VQTDLGKFRVEGESIVVGEQDVLGFVDARRPERRLPDVGMQALHQAAVRIADIRRSGSRFKTKDLVSLLLCHGARTWRNTQPPATVRLHVPAPDGKMAIRMRLR
jgi:hypothetical protein